jgi:hypothetical protein
MTFINQLFPAICLLLGAIGVLTLTLYFLVKNNRDRA